MPLMDISQFNAQLHAQRDQSGLMSALRQLTMADIGDLCIFKVMLTQYW
jgi:hypothetical protein